MLDYVLMSKERNNISQNRTKAFYINADSDIVDHNSSIYNSVSKAMNTWKSNPIILVTNKLENIDLYLFIDISK